MTPEQRKLLSKLRYFDFIPTGTSVTFKSLYPFPGYVYERSFNTLVDAIEHAKIVVTKCGGIWEVQKIDPTAWIVHNLGDNGCSVEIVCDPELYKKFMAENGVERDIFDQNFGN